MAVVCRTDALRQVGGFDSRLVYCADWLALLRLAMRGSVATLHEPLVSYRRHAEAGSTSSWTGASFVGELASGLALAAADPAFRPEWRAAVPKLFAGCLNHCARELGLSGVHGSTATCSPPTRALLALRSSFPRSRGCGRRCGVSSQRPGLSGRIPFRLVASPRDAGRGRTAAQALRLACRLGSRRALTIVCAESERGTRPGAPRGRLRLRPTPTRAAQRPPARAPARAGCGARLPGEQHRGDRSR